MSVCTAIAGMMACGGTGCNGGSSGGGGTPPTGASPPSLTLISLDPATGPPHTLVMVEGTNLQGASVIWWEPGSPSQQTLPSGYLGAYMFSIPPEAVPGRTYNVALKNSSGLSNTATFVVGAPSVAFPKPRVDYVTLLGSQFNNSGQVTATLYVQGANFDVGAVVLVNGAEIATTPHKGLRAERYQVPDSELGFPIYHYVSAVAVPGPRSVGAMLQVTVRNLDQQLSDVFEYDLPGNATSVDSDGDSLLDSWETSGYDANGDGVNEVDLLALGVDPFRRDVLLEIDVMDRLVHRPEQGVFDEVVRMFGSAPILNPTKDSGINLIIDRSGQPCLRDPADGHEECSFQTVTFDGGNNPLSTEPSPDFFTDDKALFSILKAKNFDNAKRGAVFHYAVWGIAKDDEYSGEGDFADDFIVSLDMFPSGYDTLRSRIEVLAHELGHDLGLRHAGQDHKPLYKPNYWSVMGYNWALRTGWGSDADRVSWATCLPFYYGIAGADEVGGAPPNPLPTFSDYSEGMGPTYTAASGARATMCGKTFVWDTFEGASGVMKDYADWRELVFDGPNANVRSWKPGIRP